MEVIIIGFKNDEITNLKETLEQIKVVKRFKLDLVDDACKLLSWKMIDDFDNKKTMFQAILADRKKRVDKHIYMADRPNFAAVTIDDGKIVRLEYYDGHDALKLVYDIRSKEYMDKQIEQYMTNEIVFIDKSEFEKIPDAKKRKMYRENLEKSHEGLNIKLGKYLVRPTITIEEHQNQVAWNFVKSLSAFFS